jgi:HopA1 effector protein family
LIGNNNSQIYIAYIREIEQLLRNIKITSKTSFTWGDQICEISNATEQKGSAENTVPVKESLTALLAIYLYQLIHCRQPSIDEHIAQYRNSTDDGYQARIFIESLSNANTSSGNWEPGWTVHKLERNGKIAVKKNDLMLWVLPHQFASIDNKQARVGDKCYVAMVKEFRELLPGYYMANGNRALKEQPSITRIYWNISSDGATSLLKSVTTELNNENIPFQFKILKNEDQYIRADAGVLYIEKGDIRKAVNALSNIYNKIRPFLKPSVPLFTRKLVPGISLAEDPANGDSFGQQRTRLFAEAIFDVHSKKISGLEDRVREVQKYFESHNVDFDRPYLKNAESKDEYDAVLLEFLNKINE